MAGVHFRKLGLCQGHPTPRVSVVTRLGLQLCSRRSIEVLVHDRRFHPRIVGVPRVIDVPSIDRPGIGHVEPNARFFFKFARQSR